MKQSKERREVRRAFARWKELAQISMAERTSAQEGELIRVARRLVRNLNNRPHNYYARARRKMLRDLRRAI